MTVLRRAENSKQSILLITDKTSKIGVRGFMSDDLGITSPDDVVLDKTAWKGIVDNWLVVNDALVKV